MAKIPKPKLIMKRSMTIDRVKTGRSARIYRETFGVTQSDVAAELGIAASNLHNYEAGTRKWDAELLKKYTRAVDKLSVPE